MKGILLAGGNASRFFPATKVVSKQLLSVYDKPMVYYPFSTLMLASIRNVLIVSTPRDIRQYQELFQDGHDLGMDISYAIQQTPRGVADAFIVGRDFVGKDDVALILGDNVFYGLGFSSILERVGSNVDGATIFGYYMKDPRAYGVAEFDAEGTVLGIEEKPKNPKSNYAVPGLYFYNNEVLKISEKVLPSARGEIEITSVNNDYLARGRLTLEKLGRGFAWLDTGTAEGLLQASNFIEAVQKRQGLYIACIEEIAYRKGWIERRKVLSLAEEMANTEYGQYLRSIAEQ